MKNINQILEAARRVEAARQTLKNAEEDLAGLLGEPRASKVARRPIRGVGGPSISQRVLGIIVDSGRAGVARRDILAVIGAKHEAAVHSALKAHSHAGRIDNDGGQWVASASYVAGLQRPSTEAQTRPMRMPPVNPYLEGQS